MAETPPPPAPAQAPAEAQLAALESGLKLHARIEALTKEIEAIKLEHPAEPTWEDRRWYGLLVGFSLLGGCVGFISGLSVQAGITEKLLTGVMTFVTGALLSYSGFRWRRGTEAAQVDPLRVGAGVGGFAAFVIVGVCFGIAARDGKWLSPMTETVAPGALAPGSAAPGSAAPGSAAPASAVPEKPKPDDGLGALRGCSPEGLAIKAATWRQEVRHHAGVRDQCAAWFKPQLGLLDACARAEQQATKDGLDRRDRARAYVDFGLSLDPEAPSLIELKGELGP